jgi:hypothetical protein
MIVERMSTVGVDESLMGERAGEPTLASTWEALAGARITDELLEWPADVFALTNVVLDRSEAFRFVLSPVGAWPPARFFDWAGAVDEAGRDWSAWVEGRRTALAELLREEWSVFGRVRRFGSRSWPAGSAGEYARRC